MKQGSQKPTSQPSTSKAEEKKKPCYRCDSDKHDHTACPHKENVCPHCNKVGHTKKACRALKKEQKEKPKEQARTVSQEQQQPAQSADAQQPNSVNQVTRLAGSDYWGAVRQTPRCQIFYKHVPAQGTQKSAVHFMHMSLPDTGATKTIISLDILQRKGLSYVKKTLPPLLDAQGNHMRCPGTFTMWAKADPSRPPVLLEAIVSPDLKEEILVGWEDLIALGILPPNFPEVPKTLENEGSNSAQVCTTSAAPGSEAAEALKAEFPDVITDALPEEPLEGPPMKIHLRDDIPIVPKAVSTARNIPLHMRPQADKNLAELINKS